MFRQMFSVVCTELSPRAGRRRAHRVIQRPTRTITPTSAAIATAPQVKIACGTTSELAAAIARKDNRARTKDFPDERPAARQTAERVDTVTVEAEETVTVPAGTFKTLKIVCRNKKTGLIRHEAWYSPELKQVVKLRENLETGLRVRNSSRSSCGKGRLTPGWTPTHQVGHWPLLP